MAKYLQEHGYKIIPVNPKYQEVLGEKCYPDLKSIPEKIDIDAVLRLKLSLQGEDDFIIVTGKVVWVQGFSITQTIFNHTSHYKDYDCGIEFVDVDPQHQQKISRYLKLPSFG